MIKAKDWNGKDLKGEWLFTIKIDGVRAIIKDGIALSKAGKPLYNLQNIPDGDYEVCLDSWEESVSAVRTKNGGDPVHVSDCYSLDDDNWDLYIADVEDPSAESILRFLQLQLNNGNEGLVLRQGDVWLKVKPVVTYDVPVTGIKPGKGRNKGRVGALITPMGNVGTGLTDIQRERHMHMPMGTIIEVECMELTPNGKFRHPRYKRIRHDK